MTKRISPSLCYALVATVCVATLFAAAMNVDAQGTAPPENVRAQRVPSAEDPHGVVVDASWDAVNENDVAMYVVRWKLAGSRSWRYQPITRTFERDERPRVILSSPEGIADRIEVRVFLHSGASSSWGASTAVRVAGVPTAVSAEHMGATLTVSWEYPNASHVEVVDYVVKYRLLGNWRTVQQVTAAERTATIPDVGGEVYEVRVRARFADGTKSEWTAWAEAANAVPPTTYGGPNTLCQRGGNIYDQIQATGEYNEDRVPLESHVWFFPTERSEGGRSTGQSFGHAHMLTCVPFATAEGGQAVTTEKLDLDIQSVVHFGEAHDLNGDRMLEPDDGVQVYVREIEVRGLNNAGADVLVGEFFASDDPACQRRGLGPAHCEFFSVCDASSEDTCALNSHVELDLTEAFPSDGLKQLRVAVVHEVVADGEHVAVMRAIGRAPFNLAIGKGRPSGVNANPPRNITESSGWLIELDRDGAGGYATAGFSWANEDSDVRALSATRSVRPGEIITLDARFEADACGRNCAVRRMPITDYAVFLDPDFHGGDCTEERPDCELVSSLESARDVPRRAEAFDPEAFRIQIPEGISPGPHKLVLAVEQPMVSGLNYWNRTGDEQHDTPWLVPEEWASTLNGLLVINFVVAPTDH